ncbi:MAG: TetR/AcrR family transcriptional regulator [Acidipropionibacterium acidipropionici]|uniref:TetR/AcrR family transcriptional regulator n=1 Tax=Acidipropionibacterium acidipropionici TaxID=1748 RepID=UPI0009DC29F5|nr:TetR/AcrR family transcriptional regulator [Acidipropionibacterium acidipropionici]
MPRVVDHDQRRSEIAEAALEVVLRQGLDGVTVRGVASAAGCSTGALRHYFPNQRELQAHVMAVAASRLRDMVLARVQGPHPGTTMVEQMASIIEEMLPLDETRRRELALWTALVEWERRNPPEGGSQIWADQRALYRRCIASLYGYPSLGSQDAWQPHPDADVEQWAAVLHTFVDGLAAQLIDTPGQVGPEDARSLLRWLLEAAAPRPQASAASSSPVRR